MPRVLIVDDAHIRTVLCGRNYHCRLSMAKFVISTGGSACATGAQGEKAPVSEHPSRETLGCGPETEGSSTEPLPVALAAAREEVRLRILSTYLPSQRNLAFASSSTRTPG